jgi:tRNA(Ile)-lysidine synthase
MTHSKKLSDFLTDERVPPHRRREVLVVEDHHRIVWVVGYRLAHPVRVRPSTQQIVRMRIERASKIA